MLLGKVSLDSYHSYSLARLSPIPVSQTCPSIPGHGALTRRSGSEQELRPGRVNRGMIPDPPGWIDIETGVGERLPVLQDLM